MTPLVAAQALVKTFGARASPLRAVDGVDLSVHDGEALGIVGESGCGKTTLGRLLVGLHRPDGGRVLWQGRDLADLSGGERLAASRHVQMVFQDPQASLNPRQTVRRIVEGPLRWHGAGDAASRLARVREVLAGVNLGDEALDRFPHQFSGGQRQRVGIARALVLQPRLLVLDEPTSALDVSVQAQILNLLARLRQTLGLALVMISHDLGSVRWLCDRVAVMYLGRVVESGPVDQVFGQPRHPYTQALMAAVPTGVPGRPPRAVPPPGERRPGGPGCAFAPRCPRVVGACHTSPPLLIPLGPASGDHRAACVHAALAKEEAT